MLLELKTSSATPVPAPAKPEAKPTETAAPAAAAPGAPASASASPSTPTTAAGGTPAASADDKPGRRAAAAAKKERQAQAKATEAEQKVASATAAAEKAAKYQAAIESGDPDKILAAFGLDDEKLVDLYVKKHGSANTEDGEGKGDAAELARLKAEFDAFKQELADQKVKDEEKSRQAQMAQTIRNHVDNLKATATKTEHAERFELVNAEGPGAYELAFDVMAEVHKQHGKFISYEEALDLTENHLLAQEKARMERNGKLKKLGGAAPAKAAEAKTETTEQKPSPTGLDAIRDRFKATRPRVTNAMSVSTPGTTVRAKGRAEADQRFKDKLLALQRGGAPN